MPLDLSRRVFSSVVFVCLMSPIAACGPGDNSEQLSVYDEISNSLAEFELQRAEAEDAIRLCMAEKGFEYAPPPSPQGSGQLILTEISAFLRNREDWNTAGYGFVNIVLQGDASGVIPEYERSQGPEFHKALHGVPDEPGCNQESYSEHAPVEAEIDEQWALYRDAESRALARLESDPETRDWIECMRNEGVDITGPEGPILLLLEDVETIMGTVVEDGQFMTAIEYNESEGRFFSDHIELQNVINQLYDAELRVASIDYACSETYYPRAQAILAEELDQANL